MQMGISSLAALLASLTLACSGSSTPPQTHGASNHDTSSTDEDASQVSSKVEPWACYPAVGTYNAHYTRVSGDPDWCPDIGDAPAKITPWEGGKGEVPGCTITADKAGCVLTTDCTNTEDGVTTRQTIVGHVAKDHVEGTIRTVTSGGQHPSDCNYTFTYTK